MRDPTMQKIWDAVTNTGNANKDETEMENSDAA
jgi:hypothetical protein